MKVALRKFVQSVIEKAVAEGAVCAEAPRLLALEASKVAAHGDFSTTVALLLAQYEKRPPRAVAAQWVSLIQAAPDYAQILEKVAPRVDWQGVRTPGFTQPRRRP